jgi:uncharacterized damage-inducible protein DinB
MDLTGHYRAMARYNRWMNQRLYALAAELSDAERKRDLGAFFGSLHGTLAHLLFADYVWMARFTGDDERYRLRDAQGRAPDPSGYGRGLFQDFAELARDRVRTDDDILAYAGSLAPADLARPLRYTAMSGGSYDHELAWGLSHFFNHQTHHRGQATTLLKQLGRDPGVTDLIAMLRTEPRDDAAP